MHENRGVKSGEVGPKEIMRYKVQVAGSGKAETAIGKKITFTMASAKSECLKVRASEHSHQSDTDRTLDPPQVVARCRPMSSKEVGDNRESIVTVTPPQSVKVNGRGFSSHGFTKHGDPSTLPRTTTSLHSLMYTTGCWTQRGPRVHRRTGRQDRAGQLGRLT